MTKQFIVRLKKLDGTVVANSQIITVNGIGSGTIVASDFLDNTLTGSVTTSSRTGSFVKTIAAAYNPTIGLFGPSEILYNYSTFNIDTWASTFSAITHYNATGASAGNYKLKAQNILPIYTQNNSYTITQPSTQTRYGLFQDPDTTDLAFFTNRCLINNWDITSQSFINEFFSGNVALGIIGYDQSDPGGRQITSNKTYKSPNGRIYEVTTPIAFGTAYKLEITNGPPGASCSASVINGNNPQNILPSFTLDSSGYYVSPTNISFPMVTGLNGIGVYINPGPGQIIQHSRFRNVLWTVSPAPTPTPTPSTAAAVPTPTPTPSTAAVVPTPTPTPSTAAVVPTPTPTPTQSQTTLSAGICGKSYHLDIMNGTRPWSDIEYSGMLNVARDFNPVQNIVQSSLNITAFGSNVSVPVGWGNIQYVVEWVGTFNPGANGGTFTFSNSGGSGTDDWFMMWIGPNATSGYTANNTTFRSKTNESSNVGTYSFPYTPGQSVSYPFRAIYGNGAGARSLNVLITPPYNELSESPNPTSDWSPYLRYTSCTLPAFNASSIRFFGVATNAPVSDGKGGFSPGNIINRFGFTSTAGVTRVIIKAKLDSSLISTTGVTYNSMGGTEETTYDSSNVPEMASDGKGGESPTGLIYSPAYILRLLVQNAWDHRAVPLSTGNLAGTGVGYHSQEGSVGPGQCVVGYRMFVYTNASPYPTAGFTTSSSSVPVTDYIRLGGTDQQSGGGGPE